MKAGTWLVSKLENVLISDETDSGRGPVIFNSIPVPRIVPRSETLSCLSYALHALIEVSVSLIKAAQSLC